MTTKKIPQSKENDINVRYALDDGGYIITRGLAGEIFKGDMFNEFTYRYSMILNVQDEPYDAHYTHITNVLERAGSIADDYEFRFRVEKVEPEYDKMTGNTISDDDDQWNGHFYIWSRTECFCISFSRTRVNIFTTNSFPDYIDRDAIVEGLRKEYGLLDTSAKPSKVAIVTKKSYGFDATFRDIRPMKVNLEKNYNDDFLKVHERISEFVNEPGSGIVILRGKAGTGKSTYIKHLVSDVPKRYIIFSNILAKTLSDPAFSDFLLDNRDSVIILEDCEQVLRSRDVNDSSAIANILNMADGILSDIFNIKFICTFNTDTDNIDEAVLRPGRCVVDYEFTDLCDRKASVLLKELNKDGSEIKENTLAEIYRKPVITNKEKTKTIDF